MAETGNRRDDCSSLNSSCPSSHPSYEEGIHVHQVEERIDAVDSFSSSDLVDLLGEEAVPEVKSGWIGAVFLIVNAALGAGLLDFPEAYDRAGGILISMIIQAFLLFFAVISLLILVFCANKHSCSTYQEVILRTCGRRMERLCSMFIALYCYGTCITFIIIIGDLSDRSFASLYGPSFCDHWYMTRHYVVIAIGVLFILPLCFPRRIDFLKWPSSLGVIAVFYIVGLVVYEYYMGGFPAPPGVKTAPDHWEDVLSVIPVICFGYQCHVSSIPIYACMEDKKVSTFAKSILSAILICGSVYSIAGVYGYLTFGTSVVADILTAYNPSHSIVLIGFVALGLKIITTYPILMYCGRSAVDDLLPPCSGAGIAQARFAKRIILSLAWFWSTLLIAYSLPNIDVAISCIGSMAALFIFVFPATALLCTVARNDPLYREWKTRAIIGYSFFNAALGTFIFGQVLSKSIWQFYSGANNNDKPSPCG
ncbi:putative sodium-coupled neutral amino acid transporter 7 [Galendromus occidentalis]|uniref:Sodium-coupled neutral amino acid transporter 7 n=1 Tax=Galendromus occidentalis TaxID=34638 RepID=A0AAJ6QYX8_9ACAR|nr:putative sodium-coupled neutral amino acid transporter 7 [Galendromus occidentalis]